MPRTLTSSVLQQVRHSLDSSTPLRLLSHTGLSSLLSTTSFPSLNSINADFRANLSKLLKFCSDRRIQGPRNLNTQSNFNSLAKHFKDIKWPRNNSSRGKSPIDHMDILLLLDTLSDIHNQQDVMGTFHTYLTSLLALISTNAKAPLASKTAKPHASKNILLERVNMKSLSQSTALKMASSQANIPCITDWPTIRTPPSTRSRQWRPSLGTTWKLNIQLTS